MREKEKSIEEFIEMAKESMNKAVAYELENDFSV